MSNCGALQNLYKTGEKPSSLEFFPPKTDAGLGTTKEVIARCASFPVELMTVTYGAGGTTQGFSYSLLEFIQTNLCKPAISHLTCVGQSSREIDQALQQLKKLGVKYILALRGDAPVGTDTFIPHPGGFGCARDLIKYIKDSGDFGVAAAAYPEGHKEAIDVKRDIEYLKEKVDAGAELLYTQLFFDEAMYFNFLEKTARAGISVPIVPGIMPIRDVQQLKRFTILCGASIPKKVSSTLEAIQHDKEGVIQYGVDLAFSMCAKLLQGGAPGLHFYTLNKAGQIYQLLSSLTDSTGLVGSS